MIPNLVNQVALYPYPAIALDPTFWQALGKALGWNERYMSGYPVAHRFYDLILQGKPIDEFWAELLKDNK